MSIFVPEVTTWSQGHLPCLECQGVSTLPVFGRMGQRKTVGLRQTKKVHGHSQSDLLVLRTMAVSIAHS